jgi:hypothetical protein
LKDLKHLHAKSQWPSAPQKASKNLIQALGGFRNLSDKTVLVAYGGGKDSTYMSAFVRMLQLYTANKNNGKTFNVRFVSNLQGGMLPSTLRKVI